MRPKYETDKDVANEKDVADKIAAARGYMMVKLPPMSKMDYAAFSTEGIKAFIEIKRRNVVKAKYDEMMIGLEKVMWARQAKEMFGISCFFFVQWEDALGYISLNADCEIDIGGRSDRNDPLDMGMYAYFKTSDFKEL